MQHHTVSGPQKEPFSCSEGRNANFLQLQIAVEQNSPFSASETVSSAFILSSQVACVKTQTQVSVEHTHALMQGGEVRNHTVSLPSPLFWETSRSDSTRCRSVEGKWEKKLWGVRAGSAGRSDWWSPGGRGGKQDVGRSNRCHIIPRKSPKSTSPF